MEEKSLGKENLVHSSNIEDPSKLVKRASKLVSLSSSTSLDQSSIIGRMSFPNVTSVSFGNARDPIFYENIILQPIISPITTYDEILGQDKRKVQITDGPKNKSVACMKDGKALSRLWGDEDTDATDSTIDPKTDSEVNKAKFLDVTKYLISPYDVVKQTKKGRPKKQKSTTDKNGGSENECIQTRAKSGISKASGGARNFIEPGRKIYHKFF